MSLINKLIFNAEHAEKVFPRVASAGGAFDFRSLVPIPVNIYRGPQTAGHSDFCNNRYYNFNVWANDNWGSYGNCYAGQNGVLENGSAFVMFKSHIGTLKKCPYPIIVAFANTFEIPFIYRYYDMQGSTWGIETWDRAEFEPYIHRVTFRHKDDRDKEELFNELFK